MLRWEFQAHANLSFEKWPQTLFPAHIEKIFKICGCSAYNEDGRYFLAKLTDYLSGPGLSWMSNFIASQYDIYNYRWPSHVREDIWALGIATTFGSLKAIKTLLEDSATQVAFRESLDWHRDREMDSSLETPTEIAAITGNLPIMQHFLQVVSALPPPSGERHLTRLARLAASYGHIHIYEIIYDFYVRYYNQLNPWSSFNWTAQMFRCIDAAIESVCKRTFETVVRLSIPSLRKSISGDVFYHHTIIAESNGLIYNNLIWQYLREKVAYVWNYVRKDWRYYSGYVRDDSDPPTPILVVLKCVRFIYTHYANSFANLESESKPLPDLPIVKELKQMVGLNLKGERQHSTQDLYEQYRIHNNTIWKLENILQRMGYTYRTIQKIVGGHSATVIYNGTTKYRCGLDTLLIMYHAYGLGDRVGRRKPKLYQLKRHIERDTRVREMAKGKGIFQDYISADGFDGNEEWLTIAKRITETFPNLPDPFEIPTVPHTHWAQLRI